jgi:hypothetical protein
MVTGNTETGISVTYQDTDGTLDFALTADPTLTLSGDVSGSATFTNLGNATLTATVANDSHSHSNYLPTSGGTMTGELQVNARLDVGDGTNGNHEIRIYKADNDVSDHIQFYNGTTRMGEIGCQDTTWLRINQVTAKNIYTPRYIRADGGLYVDATSRFTSDDVGYVRLTYDDTGDGGLRIYDSGNVRQGTLYGNGAGEFGLLDNDNNWFVRARTGTNNNYIYCDNNPEVYIYTSYALAPGSFRSPIFYDSNNTAYYTNPASTSIMNGIDLEGTIRHNGDTNTYMQFHAADQWRVVTGGTERLEVNNTNTTVANNLICNGTTTGLTRIKSTATSNVTDVTIAARTSMIVGMASGSNGTRVFKSGGTGNTVYFITLALLNTSSLNDIRAGAVGTTDTTVAGSEGTSSVVLFSNVGSSTVTLSCGPGDGSFQDRAFL